MTKEEFISAIKVEVVDISIDATIQTVIEPPGRSPKAELVELSAWYNSLNASDKDGVRKMVKMGVDLSTFSFLTIIDGDTVITDRGVGGEFELYYVNGPERTLLNPPTGIALHDLFNE